MWRRIRVDRFRVGRRLTLPMMATAVLLAGCSKTSSTATATPRSAATGQEQTAESRTGAGRQKSIQKLWSLDGFKAPESVLYDSDRKRLYVSNINGSPTMKNHKGFLSMVSPDGEMLSREWVTGLNAPKGLARVGNRLYVSDIDTLVEVDIDEGKVTNRYRAAGARFLNDTTADSQGVVYVSDMLGNAIYRLKDDKLERWVKDDALASPNGLLVEDDRVVVACWGAMTDGWTTEVPGHLKTVSLADKTIADLGSGAVVGNLDGLEADGHGSYLATDFTLGRLYRIHPDGTFDTLLELHAGSADIEYIPAQKRVIIPQMNDGRLDAYQLP